MIELAKKPNEYILYKRTDGELELCVLDKAGVFEIHHQLTSGEKYSYESHGEQILGLLAQKVRDEQYIE